MTTGEGKGQRELRSDDLERAWPPEGSSWMQAQTASCSSCGKTKSGSVRQSWRALSYKSLSHNAGFCAWGSVLEVFERRRSAPWQGIIREVWDALKWAKPQCVHERAARTLLRSHRQDHTRWSPATISPHGKFTFSNWARIWTSFSLFIKLKSLLLIRVTWDSTGQTNTPKIRHQLWDNKFKIILCIYDTLEATSVQSTPKR